MGLQMEHNNLSSCIKNMEISIAGDPSMFPGFRFSPTDEELISYYLKKKLEGTDSCVEVIPEIEIWKFEPWDLPARAVIQSENEWFFFSPRGRKYPNGSQSRRATETGYWKATGKERNVKSGFSLIGTKRTLVFHTGRAPKGQRTEWLMHEYCMIGKSQDSLVVCRLRKNSDFHLNDKSRKSSVNRRHSLAEDDYAISSALDQTGLTGGYQAGECCSKEGSSSINSHSVEQTDSGYESDDKIHSEFSHPRLQRSGDSEEDCFADIMKDDIIKLDDSSVNIAPDFLPMVAGEFQSRIKAKQPVEAVGSQSIPFQGTANRRLRLGKPKVEVPRAKYLICKQNSAQKKGGSAVRKPAKGLSAGTRTKRMIVYSCLVMVIMLVLCLFLLGAHRQLRGLTCQLPP